MTDANQNAAEQTQNGGAEAKTPILLNVPEGMTNVIATEVSFFFRKDKETDTKRDTVKLALPFLTVDAIVEIFEKGDPKQINLVLDSCNQQIVAQARAMVNDKEDINQENLDLSKLSWEAIANLPQAERRGGGIAKEVWEDFFKDYASTMKETAGKDDEQLERHVAILSKKFGTVRSNKKVLAAFNTFLDQYAAGTKELETFSECVDFLKTKIDTFLKADDAALLENL